MWVAEEKVDGILVILDDRKVTFFSEVKLKVSAKSETEV